jgi:hypothetical protein
MLSIDRALGDKKYLMSEGATPDDEHMPVHKTIDSLVHSWNEWYRDPWKVKNPKLFV